jgi:alpha-1,3-rhamnosyl/mannosyltransferase
VTDPSLRVGINLMWLAPGVVGGSEQYATRIVEALLDAKPDDIELVLFTLPAFARAHPQIATRCVTVVAPVTGDRRPVRVLAESTWLAIEARRRRIDVAHHVGGRVPLVVTAPSVVTIHDLQPLDHPENFSAVKRAFLGRALPRTARRARFVTTPSEFVRRGVISQLGVDDDRAYVVSAPVALAARPLGTARPTLVGDRPYFLYPAITYVHKNHAVLIDAFARVVAERPEALLVLTGGDGPCEADVRARIARLGLTGSVLRPGRVPATELDALVAHATALVFPSRYEGFGLPVAEAMAAGCPVIAADATALPEVVGDAGVLVAPDDIDAWHHAMRDQLDADRATAGARGRAAVARYSAARAADTLLDLYRRAARPVTA